LYIRVILCIVLILLTVGTLRKSFCDEWEEQYELKHPTIFQDEYLDFTPVHDITDKIQRRISIAFLKTVDKVEEFFLENPEDIEERAETSTLWIHLGALYREDTKWSTISKFKLNIRLRRLEKKLNIVIDNLADSITSRDPSEDDYILEQRTGKKNEQSIALVYLFNLFKNRLKIKLTGGLRLPLRYYIKLKFSVPFTIKTIEFEPAQYFQYSAGEFIEKTRLDIYKYLTDLDLVSFYVERYKQDVDSHMSFTSRIGYYRTNLEGTKGYAISAGLFGQNAEHPEILNYIIETKFRTQFWKKWLYFEISPGFDFPIENGHKAVFFTRFQIEMFFGRFSSMRKWIR